MRVRCVQCDWERDVAWRTPQVRALYKCHKCRKPITSVSVFRWAEWLETNSDRLERERATGRIGTRKQSPTTSDREISVAGLAAEMAACVVLAPWRVREWIKRTEANENNRGCDLPSNWFRDGRAVEIKYTPRRGHLLVRPPRNTPGKMLRVYIEDSIYVLMNGEPYTFECVGWAGRSDLLKRGRLNPVPVRNKQRECWGIHADSLNSMELLFDILYRADR